MQTNAIFDFIKKNSYLVILIVIIIVLAYGYALGTIDDLSIDEENTFQGSTATHAQNWVGFSRYGLAFTHVVLFPVFDAIPYLNGILSVLFLGASALFLCYYIQQILSPVKPPKIAYAFLCAAVIAYPSNLDYLSFNSINAAVSVGIFLSVLSTYMISRYIFEKQKLGSAIVGVVIAAFVFSIYQAFVGAYLTLIVMYALLYLFSDKFRTQRLKVSFCAQVILKHIAALGASLGLFYAGNYIVRLASGVNN
ncbi:MAG: glucosyltransferase domain-containing protein, partial [Eubacteriales bacterium]